MRLVLSSIFILTSIGIGTETVAQSRAPEAWVQIVESVKAENPALALSSLAQTVNVLGVVADTREKATIAGWLSRHHGSPQGRHSITLFVPSRGSLKPTVSDRIARYGGQVKLANEAPNFANSNFSSSTGIIFAVYDRYHYAAQWGRGFPPGLTRPAVFYGRRRKAIVPFMNERQDGIYESNGHTRRLILFLEDGGRMEFVWAAVKAFDPDLRTLGSPFQDRDLGMLQVSLPRLKLKHDLSLRAALTRSGLRSLFEPPGPAFPSKAGLPPYLSDVVQWSNFVLDERGVQLEADTMAYTSLGGPHGRPRARVVVDQPFWLRLADQHNMPIYLARVDQL